MLDGSTLLTIVMVVMMVGMMGGMMAGGLWALIRRRKMRDR
jgi:hypothetical protein